MEIETDDSIIQTCLRKIELQLGWGNGEEWSTQDFESLSKKIQEATGVALSVATLKRIWGKIKYDSKPTVTTLNTLSQFIGYENWRTFKQKHTHGNSNGQATAEFTTESKSGSNKKWPRWVFIPVLLIALGSTYFLFSSEPVSKPPDPAKFSFSSKKVVDSGVPNSVIFDYDASAASASDSIFIQQSWDPRLSKQVDRNQTQHTSIYYYPGFFEAKLRINETVVKEHKLFITTDGWLPMVDQKPVPVYYKSADAIRDGKMELTVDQLTENNIQLQPTPPHVSFYNLGDFGDVKSDNLILETEIRNVYDKGANACQFTDIRIQFEGAALVVPLSAKGCVSELSFMDKDGKKSDLSMLGCDFSQWVKIKVDFAADSFQVTVQDKSMKFPKKVEPVKFVGLGYQFQGTGSVNMVKVTNHEGKVFYEENF